MATRIKEKFDGVRTHHTAEKREYWCTYLVWGVAQVYEFPAYFRWDCKGLFDIFARLIDIGAAHQTGPDSFEVEAHYSTLPFDFQQRVSDKDQPANPLARNLVRSWDTGYIEMIYPVDLDNKPYCAANGEPYLGGMVTKVPYLVKRYRRNEAFFNDAAALACIWATDESKKILCTRFAGSEQMTDTQTGIEFVSVDYEFWCLGGGDIKWEEKKLNSGSYYWKLDSSTGKYVKRFEQDDAGTKIWRDGIIYLNDQGGSLLPQNWQPGQPFTPVWNVFRNYETANFSGLNLPGI